MKNINLKQISIAVFVLFFISINENEIFAQSPSWLWAKGAGVDNSSNEGRSICLDASGNSYITGSFAGATITFGSITLTNTGSAGTGDFFIAKYDAFGNAVWAKGAGGGTLELGQCICIDGAGNIYAAGYFYGNMVFGSTTLINNGAGDIFIAKYDNSGNLIWAKSAGSSVNDEPAGICIDKNQNVLLTGHSYGNITFGSTVLTNAGDADVFLVKYDPSGNVI